jgi:sarcosine oxidase subunit beta
VPRKLILCRCEDVTAADIEHAIGSGYTELEEVKRYTGFGTGPCQGKECQRVIALAIAAATGRAPETMRPFTTRPPISPTELRVLACAPARGRDPDSDRDRDPDSNRGRGRDDNRGPDPRGDRS